MPGAMMAPRSPALRMAGWDPVWSKNSCSFARVIFQESPESFTTLKQTFTLWGRADRRKEQHIGLASSRAVGAGGGSATGTATEPSAKLMGV
jgi:hypothetical protein